MKRRYEYALLPLVNVVGLTDAREKHPDSFVAADAESAAYFKLLADGYQWVRTDGDWCVFERIKVTYPALETR
jgi:hypothetical protein